MTAVRRRRTKATKKAPKRQSKSTKRAATSRAARSKKRGAPPANAATTQSARSKKRGAPPANAATTRSARSKKRGAPPAKKASNGRRSPAAAEGYGKRSDYGASVDDFVEKLPSNQKEIVNALREIVREAVPGVAETIRWGMPVFARKKLICYASTKSDYVRFGFYARIELEDPDDRVSGALAYVKLRDVTEIERPLLQNWIRQVVEHTGA